MKKRYNPYNMPPWLRNLRALCNQFVIPFCIFQGIRTFFFPTAFDILFLGLLIFLAISLRSDWI
ncbi:hypothetical protein [Peribacillus alkalitolerans]|uniref:hypothetical protein n=1 Tax=Peribacillus alkalitolerans TaxID=1550385 RepID=UPI0013D594FD|nr:hypothetical protein [Peribacillus alkalitolerans]